MLLPETSSSSPGLPSRRVLPEDSAISKLLGGSPAMQSVIEWVAAVCHTEAPVLITGETGTGKELVARALHFDGPRKNRPFVAVNCAAISDSLIESELFGHAKGAFTGAMNRREGRFKMADRGTLFLDEVGELTASAQAKLLRVLQEGTIEPLGMDATIAVDVRVLAATHCDLEQRIAEGRFRQDLYYRLNVLSIELPPLRARVGDLPLLVQHLVKRFSGELRPRMSARASEAINAYPFPGNVRELENVIQHALAMANGHDIELAHLPRSLTRNGPTAPVAAELVTAAGSVAAADLVTAAGPGSAVDPVGVAPARPRLDPLDESELESNAGRPHFMPLSLADARRVFERAYLVQVLGQNEGRRACTARALKISRKGLWEKLRDHGIRPQEYGGSVDEETEPSDD